MKKLIYFFVLSAFLYACKKKETPAPPKVNTIPEFFVEAPEASYGQTTPFYQLIADKDDKIDAPQDLDFHPIRPNELWIINKGIPNTGGSTVMLTNVGMDNQQYDWRRDGNAYHFMSQPSAISFSSTGFWGTTANILDANHAGGTFTGPTLWSSDLSIYAKPSGGNGSHMDMLHGTPFGMGIETEKDNVYWVFDGYNQHIVRYDFAADHGPGNDDHSDGKIHRYVEVGVTRNASGLPSHIVLDKNKKWLYIVDGGNSRILKLDITTGAKTQDLNLINEMLAEHWEMKGVTVEVIIPKTYGLNNPTGIEVKDNRLFVAEYSTGDIYCFDINNNNQLLGKISTGEPGIIGIKIGGDNKIWYVNELTNTVNRVVPQ